MTDYKIHITSSEEKLSAIAQKYNTTAEKIKALNPTMRLFGGFFGGEFVSVNQRIKIPVHQAVKKEPTVDEYLNNLEFEKQARYRCEQINITRVNENIITLSSELRCQYLYSLSKSNPLYMQISLEDYNFSVDPSYFKDGFEFSQKIENLKKRVIISLNNKGEINEILNKNELKDKWIKFRDKELPITPLYKDLKEKASDQAQDIINTGNTEFSSSEKLGVTLGKNLFFHIFLRSKIGEELENYQIKQYSQLFPNLELNSQVIKSKVKEENGISTYRLVGTLDKENILEEELRKRYDELYKPMIKYNYTEFNYIYRITYSIENNTNLLLEAKASLSEKIKNNFEVITEYTIRKVEL